MRRQNAKQNRRGFTLVELLIVITIILLLLTMTVLTVRFTQDSDRVPGAARQVQSFLSGARDRALYYRRPIGVRMYLDSDALTANSGVGEQRTVSAMAYIDSGELWDDGQIQLRRWDPDLDGRTNIPSGTSTVDINGDGIPDDPTQVWMVAGLKANKWWELKRRGLLVDGMRIRIPAGKQGTWYPVDTRLIDITSAPAATQYLVLQIPYADRGDTNQRTAVAFGGVGPDDYELELPATLMPVAPSLLPDSVVVDLDGSSLPTAWRPSALNGGSFSPYMDIVFSPKGNVIGDAASTGLIHLYVCDRVDATDLKDQFIDEYVSGLAPTSTDRATNLAKFEAGVSAGVPFVPGEEIDPATYAWVSGLSEDEPYLPGARRLISVFTQTGSITVHDVNPTDSVSSDGLADDPYLFAETGAESK
ncbi:MAG: prepilin-type N-terminal cleavage/methylation domain-containing protein [Planctomycetaceae bacterium]|nr:prepilin-type N-terminal cleavage/methylation domain-containing protein [Planctomycetaceae bacterium]